MFPQFQIFGITIYVFGLSLVIGFFLFFGMLHKLSIKFGINTNFFSSNALSFFLSMFIFSRIFFVFAEWRDYKFIFDEGILKFFFMNDFNFSFIGGVFGFLSILFILIKRFKLSTSKYIDASMLSFFFAGTIVYLGAFLGGQIYGIPTSLAIGVVSDHPLSKIPFTTPVIPLALIYSGLCFLLFVIFYIIRSIVTTEGFIGYFSMAIFGCFLLIGEFFNGNNDMFHSYFSLNLTQLGSIVLILIGIRGVIKAYHGYA